MNKLILAFIFFLFIHAELEAQVSKALEKIIDRRHEIGFEVFNEFDSTRLYRGSPRYLQILAWYPAVQDSLAVNMSLLEYAELTANEINVRDTLRSFKEGAVNRYVSYYTDFGINNFKFKKELAGKTFAKQNAKPKLGKYPVVYFVQGRSGSPVENFAMCEYLASNGYIVATIPAFGTNHRGMEFNNTDFKTQVLDQDFVFNFVNENIPNIDKQRQAYVGFSYGSITSLLGAMNNPEIKAVVSIDGSIGFKDRLPAIEKYPGYIPQEFTIPVLHLNSYERPGRIDLSLLDSLASNQKYVISFANLSHIDFTSFGIIKSFAGVVKIKPTEEFITEQKYFYEYVLSFLEMTLRKNRWSANRFLNASRLKDFPVQQIMFERLK